MSTNNREDEIEKPNAVSREEWLTARLALLNDEKQLTRLSDELAKKRQQLPRVKIDKEYTFETTNGKATLAALFNGRSQLLVYHFMFGPDYEGGCPSCSAIADGFNGITSHLANHDVMLWAVSRAPLEKLHAYAHRLGWTFPWASSFHSDFNFDFGVSFTEEQQREGIVYNYYQEPAFQALEKLPEMPSDGASVAALIAGTDVSTFTRERPGFSSFILEAGEVYHTYSAYSRGLDAIWNAYQWFDRAPKGRNEQDYWWRRHDEYEQDLPGKTSQRHCCH